MEICIIGDYPPQKGGISTHLDMLVKELAKRDHKISLITYGKFKRKEPENVKIYETYYIDIFFLRGLVFFINSLIILFKIKPKLIHAHPLHPAGTLSILYKKISNTKVIVTSHGSDILKWANKPFLKKLFSFVGNQADMVICVSKYLKKRARKLGINNPKVIYNAIPSIKTNINKSRTKQELFLPKNRKVVLFIGSLEKNKNPEEMIKLAKKNKKYLFFLIGEGSLKTYLKNKIRSEGLENIHLLGGKSRSEVIKYLSASDVLVSTSKYEGFGLSLLEGIASHIPVISKEFPTSKELLVEDGVSNDLNSLLNEVLKNNDFAKRIIQGNKRKAKKFDKGRMVNEIEKLYKKVLSA